jgi:L-glutamine-phosphate cytidylyltransferase
MKGIILAAGRGSRMGSLTTDLPKCRVKLKGKELIQWQLDNLTEGGVENIGIIRGYLANTFNFDVEYFYNERWSETNMVVSLQSASLWLEQEVCIISYSDIVYTSRAVMGLKAASGDIVISYDPNWKNLWSLRFEDPLTDAETFKLHDNRVIEIGNKTESYDDIEGQYMGLIKCTPKGWQQIQDFLEELTQKQRDTLDMTGLLKALIENKIDISAVAIDDNWFEVDSEEDLNIYESLDIKL